MPWLLNMRKGLDHIRKKTIEEVKAAQEAVSALEAGHDETGEVSPQLELAIFRLNERRANLDRQFQRLRTLDELGIYTYDNESRPSVRLDWEARQCDRRRVP